ncbi:dipeptidyl-peptidase IV, Serine peptidase, MEROPS family S09B [Novosphingobium aromaticivorans DSM 12444]|uniref:Dipeptidyl-peptidase IV, Serine peptidase, MEROPS family S09B n=1 Tax=Novosphingobium aromaticivorans (strain ATCC 700278 / DSM 12444 / CCUG 56034 / CIP 105152 / NBRC 16084 / F199) TaxID=279238 RepID=Q2G8H0_NOVAD|nr:DPP IV N-terminal domain-containing protein [Novosphingobium aromaticivorans]ABD25853.1 dipeptidyl-peptidase IV, Serine peptidase, MEROPS family S09B [Novosphingobium aromaticivorans DSM 12444]SCY05783.1 dipeptidyl-peptidase IV Serine peptidase. MEROPS family S09B [Novosphingobium aromaticivorans]
MRHFRLLAACALSSLAIAPLAHAQQGQSMTATAAPAEAGALTFERVFASPSLNGLAPRAVKLSPDGRYLTLLRNRADDRERYDLWGFDRQTGEWKMLVDSLKLSSGRQLTEAEKMQRERQRIGDLKGIVSYEWSADSKSVLVPVDGDLLLAGLDGSVRKVEGTKGGELTPKLGPKGEHIAFVRDRRLWAGPVTGTAAVAITPEEANADVHWGEAEFVAQEEMNRFNGFWWSPDESRIAVERFDESMVGVVTRAAIGAEGTKTFDQRYPAAGTPNAEVSLYVIGPDGSNRVQVDLGANKDIYLARVDWAPDGKTLYVQRMNREQTVLDMLKVDPVTGKSSVLFSEKAAAKHWIDLSDSYRFLADGSLIWWSQRDGFGHLYRFKNGKWSQLTKGEWVVTGLVGVDEKGGKLYLAGTKDDVLAPQVYAMDLKAPGKLTRLTELGWVNGASMDKSGQTLMITRSSDAQPAQSYIADTAGKNLAWIEENKVAGSHPYAPYLASHRPAQFGTIPAADGTPLHYMMITPPLEPGKKYPVFTYHYGGPTAQVVTKGFQGALAQAIVDKGYIYFAIDNRGSENRGVKFASALHHAMGSVEVEDQLAGANWLKKQAFVDADKISTFGWSYGGYMSIKMLEANPGAYAAGIAVAPVTKWQMYDTTYTERYLGDPGKLPEVYEKANALADTGKISDPLLIIHGMADDNVVFENASAIIAKMQAEAVPFEMMLYPGYTHRISGPKVSQHLYETIFRFLDRNGAGSGK